MTELLYEEESFKIIGICMEIHKTLAKNRSHGNVSFFKNLRNSI